MGRQVFESRKKRLSSTFSEKCSLIEAKKQMAFLYTQFGSDSAEKTRTLTRSMDSSLTDAIDYYRTNYKDYKERYQSYLEVLFVYKKMLYAFQKWYKNNNAESVSAEKKEKQHTLIILHGSSRTYHLN